MVNKDVVLSTVRTVNFSPVLRIRGEMHGNVVFCQERVHRILGLLCLSEDPSVALITQEVGRSDMSHTWSHAESLFLVVPVSIAVRMRVFHPVGGSLQSQ